MVIIIIIVINIRILHIPCRAGRLAAATAGPQGGTTGARLASAGRPRAAAATAACARRLVDIEL